MLIMIFRTQAVPKFRSWNQHSPLEHVAAARGFKANTLPPALGPNQQNMLRRESSTNRHHLLALFRKAFSKGMTGFPQAQASIFQYGHSGHIFHGGAGFGHYEISSPTKLRF